MTSKSDVPPRRKSKLSMNGEELSIGQHIDKIGFGWYQVQTFIFCAGALWCEGTNLSSVAGVKMLIYKDFHITSDLGQSLVVTILYIGFALGTGFSGSVGDVRGRRLPIMIGFMGLAFTQLLLYVTTWLPLFYCFIFALGFFAGFPIPAAVTMMGEVSPGSTRSITVAALCVGFSMGETWSAVGLRLFVPDLLSGVWRMQLLWALIPPVFLLLLGLFCGATRYDSPHFLASRNRQKDLRGVLNLMAECNSRPECTLLHDLPEQEEHPDVTFGEVRGILFSGIMGLNTFVLCIMFFTFNWGYYGTVDFWPLGWAAVKLKGVYSATEMIYTAVIGFLGVPVAVLTMWKIDRRPGLCISAVLCAVAAICLQGLLTNDVGLGWAGVILFKTFWMTFQMTNYILPNEIYPTRISVWGWSIVCFFGRLGCILAPLVISYTPSGFLVALTCLLIASAALVWKMPETKHLDLDSIDDKHHSEILDDKEFASRKMQYGSFADKTNVSSA